MAPGPGPRSTSPPSRHNVRTLRAAAAPARMCAVVKANGYGHGAAAVGTRRARGRRRLAGRGPGRRGGRAARRAASRPRSWCCPSPASTRSTTAIATGARLTVYTSACVGRHRQVGAGPAGAGGARAPQGRHRHAPRRCAPADVVPLAKAIADLAEVELEGVCTHCPVADEPGNPFTDAADGAVRRRAGRAAGVGHRPGHRPRGQLGGHARRARGAATTWCGAASPSTASRRRPSWRAWSTCEPALTLRQRGVVREAGGRGRGRLLRAPPAHRHRDTVVATVPDRVRRRRVPGAAAGAGRRC